MAASSPAQDVDRIGLDNNALTLHFGQDKIVFRVCLDNMLEIDYQPGGIQDASTEVIFRKSWDPAAAIIDTSEDPILITANGFTAEIGRSPFALRIMNILGQVIQQSGWQDFPRNSLRYQVLRGNIYGLTNNAQGTLTKNSGASISAGSQGHAGAPFLWSTEGWGIVADLDGGGVYINGPVLDISKPAGFSKKDFDLYFILGNPADIFQAMADLTGRPPLFPRFSFGFLNTEWGMDEAELLRDVRTYREKGIPVDAYVLDFDWMAYGEDNYGEFRWGPKFPGALIGTLQDSLDSLKLELFGIRKPRIHLNTVQGNFCSANGFFVDTQTDYFTGRQVGRLDFRKSGVRDWYWNSFAVQEGTYGKGIIGYWNDEADEYGGNFMFMQMQRSHYEGQRAFNNKRVWSINRNFYLGAQRYAYAHWSGDIRTGFQSMADQRTFMLTSVALGSGWWSMDTGGFQGTPSPENYIRWLQFACFVPVMRVHGTYGEEREPWNYGPDAERIARNVIRLRHELIPYISTYAWENHLTGVSIIRPMCFVYPEDVSFANTNSQWFFGNEMLVRPVVEPGAAQVTVSFPPGVWIDYFRGDTFSGPAAVDYPVSIDDIPLFIRGGSIIPMQPAGRIVDDPDTSLSVLKIVCFPGGNGSFELYEDDGKTYNYEQGISACTGFSTTWEGEVFVLNIGARTGPYLPPSRDYMAVVRGIETKPLSASLDATFIEEKNPDTLQSLCMTGWAYDALNRRAYVRLPDDGAAHEIRLSYASSGTRVKYSDIPSSFLLFQNYPNPFNAETTISFDLPQTSQVILTVVSIQGKILSELIGQSLEGGHHTVRWDGTDCDGRSLPGGMYLVHFRAGRFKAVRKILLLR